MQNIIKKLAAEETKVAEQASAEQMDNVEDAENPGLVCKRLCKSKSIPKKRRHCPRTLNRDSPGLARKSIRPQSYRI